MYFYLLQNVQIDPPSLLFDGYGCSFQGIERPGEMLTTHQHLVAKLRMSGAVPLFHLHAFMAWTWKTLPNIFCPSHCTLNIKEFVDERFETISLKWTLYKF
jgi:hypothetical protein